MVIRTVTTTDRSLLPAVRHVLDGSDEALCCVAFANEQGVHLLKRSLSSSASARLAVTTQVGVRRASSGS